MRKHLVTGKILGTRGIINITTLLPPAFRTGLPFLPASASGCLVTSSCQCLLSTLVCYFLLSVS